MELDDLKLSWANLDQKLDRNWKLNLQLIRQTNLDKAQRKITNLIWAKGLALAVYFISLILFVEFTFDNLGVIHLATTGILLSTWTLAICITSIHELHLITTIDYALPVPDLQKKLVSIRLATVKYLRLGIWIIPLSFAFTILFFKAIFGVDIVAVGDTNWMIANGVFSLVVFVPLAIWLTKKISPKNAEKKWMNKLLKGNGSQITTAIDFLKEIESFEKEESAELNA